MKQTDIIYLAGFIDGEGSITMIHGINNGYSPFIAITNTNKAIIEWVQKRVGRGKIHAYEAWKEGQKPYYTWRIYNRQALELAKELLPYLKIKRVQAQLLIDYYEGFELNKQNQLANPDSSKIMGKFRALNQRGV